jgi:predicted amidohydrolase
MLQRYSVACVQSNVWVVDENDPSSAEPTIRKNLERNMQLVDYLCQEPRYGPKLLSFSEFCLTGVPEGRSLQAYIDRSVYLPGYVTEIIGERAAKWGVWIACNTFEKDDDWPGRCFNTSFLVGPSGEMILRYRKNNDFQGGTPANTNPGDFYTPYVEKYGGNPEVLFPCVDTEIGRLGLLTCVDVRYAEAWRMMALQGVEVLIHPTAEGSGPVAWRQTWDAAKSVRAWENCMYVISTNNGHTYGSLRPEDRQRGLSRIINYDGGLLAITDGSGESICTATIDLEALRQTRQSPGHNVVTTSRYETYIPMYQKYVTWPIDSFADRPHNGREDAARIGNAVIKKMNERGSLVKPEGGEGLRRSPF